MNKKILCIIVFVVTTLGVVNLQVTQSPVSAALSTDQTDHASNRHLEFSINIKLRFRFPQLAQRGES